MSAIENSIQTILRTAIQREIEAHVLYSAAAEMVEAPHAKKILKELAIQEVGYRRKLEALAEGKVFSVLSKPQKKKVVDLKITDYLVEIPLAPDSELQDILIVAGKREKASHDLYASLVSVAEDSDTANLFDFLANEELMHKRRIESLYDDLATVQFQE